MIVIIIPIILILILLIVLGVFAVLIALWGLSYFLILFGAYLAVDACKKISLVPKNKKIIQILKIVFGILIIILSICLIIWIVNSM